MGTIQTFLEHFNFSNLIYYLVQAVAALLCIVIHEMSHGYAALALGDQTAKQQGRLSFNPLHHIDPLGLLLMITAGFGWAKPVPVDMRRFRNPKRGMALTALAGPVSNFVLALAAMFGARAVLMLSNSVPAVLWDAVSWTYTFLIYLAILSVGLGVFNLIPIPPLDGSKVLFSLLPNGLYARLMYYERYLSLALFALVFLGWLDAPLQLLRGGALRALSRIAGLQGIF